MKHFVLLAMFAFSTLTFAQSSLRDHRGTWPQLDNFASIQWSDAAIRIREANGVDFDLQKHLESEHINHGNWSRYRTGHGFTFSAVEKNGEVQIYRDQGANYYPQWNNLAAVVDVSRDGYVEIQEMTSFGFAWAPRSQLTCVVLVRESESGWSYREAPLQQVKENCVGAVYSERAKVTFARDQASFEWVGPVALNPPLIVIALDLIR